MLDFNVCCFVEGLGLMCFCQAADFADRVASGVLTVDVAAEVESLRAQHADAVREKSAVESKNRRLAEKVAALEAEKTDLRRQLVEERRGPTRPSPRRRLRRRRPNWRGRREASPANTPRNGR